MSSEKRKFKYRLSGFEQMWAELERLEEREMILITALSEMSDTNDTDDRGDLFQHTLHHLRDVPGKSAGYKMIETMGIEFYEKAKGQFGD